MKAKSRWHVRRLRPSVRPLQGLAAQLDIEFLIRRPSSSASRLIKGTVDGRTSLELTARMCRRPLPKVCGDW